MKKLIFLNFLFSFTISFFFFKFLCYCFKFVLLNKLTIWTTPFHVKLIFRSRVNSQFIIHITFYSISLYPNFRQVQLVISYSVVQILLYFQLQEPVKGGGGGVAGGGYKLYNRQVKSKILESTNLFHQKYQNSMKGIQ